MTRARGVSLVRRLTIGVAVVALLSFAAQALVLRFWIRPIAYEATGLLTEQAITARAALAAVPSADRPALAARLFGDGAQLSRTEPAGLGPAGMPPPMFTERATALAAQGIDARFSSDGAGRFVVAFSMTIDDERWWLTRSLVAPTGALVNTLTLWMVMLAAATIGALLVSVRTISRPLGRLAVQIADRGTALRPLPVEPRLSSELRALVESFNRLVADVSAAASARQQLLAGVSHDLRTPIARLRLRIETQCESATAAKLEADLHSLERIVEQFLAYVQGDNRVAAGVEAPLAATVRTTLAAYTDAHRPLRHHIDEVALPLPDLAVRRIVTNLVDNAFVHGRAPVEVELQRTADGADLIVSDGGAGLSGGDFERAQQPFVRLGATRGELGHCGLGLAIVAQLARQLRASIRVRPAAATEPFAIVVSFRSAV